MRYVEVAGARLSAIGVGTWQFGSFEWGYGEEYASSEALAIINRALDLGINLIDTAEIYGFGRSERIVGKALEARREDAFIATKVFPVAPVGPIVEMRGRASAARLGVEVIDLYQVHWPNPLFPVGLAMDGMRKLHDAGVVRHVGVSNFPLSKWMQAERALGHPVMSNQVQYSLVARKPEKHLLPHAQAKGRVIIAYSPLAQGFLAAKYDSRNLPSGIGRRLNPLFIPENLDRAEDLLQALREIASGHGATPAQVALAWLIRRPNVVAIPGASSVKQLEANAAAADLDLSEEEDARLTEAADRFRPMGWPASLPGLIRAQLRR